MKKTNPQRHIRVLPPRNRWQRRHPEIFTNSVEDFYSHLLTTMHVAHLSYVVRGLLGREVGTRGTRDASLSAAATVLEFIGERDLESPEFAKLRATWSDHVHFAETKEVKTKKKGESDEC